MVRLLDLQILRALAALMVAVHHAQNDAAGLAARGGVGFTPLAILPWTAGVDLFFVISGFIMVYASRDLFAAEGGRRAFLVRRVSRIVPIYWAVTTVYLGLALAAPGLLNSALLEPWPILASYLFIPFARPDGLVQPLYSLGWTLNYEMYFYALFALALAWPRRQAALGLIGILIAIVLGGRVLAPLPQPLGFWSDPIILEFAFGMGIGLIQSEGFRLKGLGRLALALLGIVLLSIDLTAPGGAVVLPRALAHGVPAAFIVAAAALGRNEKRKPGLGLRFAAGVGDASYALYLIHPFVIRGGSVVLAATGLGAVIGPWGYVVMVLLGSILAALLTFRLFERPATAILRRFLEGRPAKVLPATAARRD